jgi:hypothetical protein
MGNRSARPATTAGRGCCGRSRPRAVAPDHHRHPACARPTPWPPGGELRRLVRISYAKVAEFQRRGAIHLHAVIRLDAATACRCPACLAPPPEPFTVALLKEALRQAVPAVTVLCPSRDKSRAAMPAGGSNWTCATSPRTATRRGSCRRSKWPATSPSTQPRPPRASGPAWTTVQLPTTSTASTSCPPTSVSLSGPAGSWVAVVSWRLLGCGPGRTCSGSVVTGRPRAAVFDHLHGAAPGSGCFRKRRRAHDGVPLDGWGRPEDDQAVVVVASWVYVGSGYETEGERWLALSAAARAREQRRIAREQLTTTTASAVAA